MVSTLYNDIITIPLSKKGMGFSCLVFITFVVFYISGSNSAIHNYIQVILFGAWVFSALLEGECKLNCVK